MDDLNYMNLFAQNLKYFRESLGLKQVDIAERIRVSPQTISAYENNKYGAKGKNPTLDKAIALARLLGVSLDTLCGLNQGSPRKPENLADVVAYLNELSKYYDCSVGSQVVELPEEQWEFYTTNDGVEEQNTTTLTALFGIGSYRLATFYRNRNKMKSLLDDGTIDETLYRSWYAGEIESLKNTEVKKRFDSDPDDLDYAVGIMPTGN